MRVFFMILFLSMTFLGLSAHAGNLSIEQKVGYAMGMTMGKSIKQTDPMLDIDSLLNGIRDEFKGRETLLTDQEAQTIRINYLKSRQLILPPSKPPKAVVHDEASIEKANKLRKLREETAFKNALLEDKFFKMNKKKQGVVTTESGMQYIKLRQGTGAVPSLNDIVSVHYIGSLISGQEIDNSYTRNEPVMFKVKDALPGWIEALQLMQVGTKFKAFMPARITYGVYGSGTLVEPAAALIFDIELVAIETKKSYLAKTKEEVFKTPPYTDPKLPIKLKRSEIVERTPYITKDDVNLQTGKDAAISFMKVWQFLMPVSTSENSVQGCDVVATEDFFAACKVRLENRIGWLKTQEGVNGADFVEGGALADAERINMYHVSWKEVFSFKDGSQKIFDRKIGVQVKEDNGEWKVSSVKNEK